ncbi:hypothetical protein KC335_g8805, partial [Hortaea werneckii]
MSILASVKVPMYSPATSKGKRAARASPPRRVYGDEPLPVKLSDVAPRGAQIVGRVLGSNGAFYTLKIGDTTLKDVAVDEVLDYISADHLEEYETQQFAEEAELLRIAETENERMERERQDIKRERTLRKGTVEYQEIDDAGNSGNESYSTGGQGRARPTYKNFFKPIKERRRRKRDPETGELMPLSDEESADTSDDSLRGLRKPSSELVQSQQPTRRRRKRDPVTGQLMPLAPLETSENRMASRSLQHKKRPRRRRHPITQELMPLGWRYNPNEEGRPQASGSKDVSPAMHRMSLSQEEPTKRLKLQHSSCSSDESPSEDALGGRDPSTEAGTVVTKSSTAQGHAKSPESQLGTAAAAFKEDASKQRKYKQTTLTSIMQPTANLSSVDDSGNEDEADDVEDAFAADEYVMEAVLAHQMSDPKTHPGKEPVMLYQVKWEGYDEPTWEPAESFPDPKTVEEYHRAVKARKPDQPESSSAGNGLASKPLPQPSNKRATAPDSPVSPHMDGSDNGEEESDEDGIFEIERIVDHRMSDPEEQGLDFGRAPVQLYQVKWRGFEALTWETIDSFEGLDVIHDYRRQAGLPALSDEDYITFALPNKLAFAAGLAFLASSLSFFLSDKKKRGVLLQRLHPRGRRATESFTPPRSLSPDKQGLPSNKPPSSPDYSDAFPPSRRHVLADLKLHGSGPSAKDLSEQTVDQSKRVPNTEAANTAALADYTTPTGFTVDEIRRLGEFPDYAKLSGVPLPNPYTAFDISKAKPRPYRPLRWAYHQTMYWWLELEHTYADRVRQRESLFQNHGPLVLQALPGSEIATKELMEMCLQFLCARYPQYFKLDVEQMIFHNEILKTETDLRATEPLHVLLHNVPEDFAIMLRDPQTGIYAFRAGIICSSLGWSLGSKIGLQLHEIHEPIPDYKEKMQFS